MSVTLVPAGPLIWLVTASASFPAIDCPLTPVMISPGWMPASRAGVSL